MEYPGRVICVGEEDKTIVRAIKSRLNELVGPDPATALDVSNGTFGPKMERVLRIFQARHVDSQGRALRQDGEVGSITWEALFGTASVQRPAPVAAESLLGRVLIVAAAEEEAKVREQPPNSNRGERVETYLRSVGLGGGFAWCCAFVHWCFAQAASQLNVRNPMVKTGGCLDHWRRAPSANATLLSAAQATDDPTRVVPGMVFIMDHGQGMGHTGLVERVEGGWLTTIEGNTDASRTREGGGVYRLKRKVVEVNKGFIRY